MTSKKQGTSAPALAEGNRGHFSATSSSKPITYTIRVICKVNLKNVQIYKNFVVQSLNSSFRQAVKSGSFAALGLALELSELQMCLTDWRGQVRNYNLSTLVNV
jgi:hypothetical protein